MGTKGKLAIRACAAAVACAFATGAAAQSFAPSFEQTQVGLERAIRQPMEIVWLQSQILADMWKTPGLAQSLEGSSLLVWSFGSFKAPFVRPRLNLASGKRLLMVSGDTAELIDGRYPNIHIELPVRPGQSLLDGLAAADIGKIFGALVQGAGRMQAEPIQVAAVGASVVAKRPDPLITHIARVVEAECTIPEVATPLPERNEAPIAVAAIDLSALVGRMEVPRIEAIPVAELTMPAVRVEIAEARPFELIMPAVTVEVAHAAPAAEMIYAAVVVEAAQALPLKPVQVAAAAPKPVSADLAKMRAEIEAEVAKENERFAQMIKGGAGAKQFRFGT